MTNNSDDVAFEKWHRNQYLMTSDHTFQDPYSKKAWQAAILHERKRSEKLLEIVKIVSEFTDHDAEVLGYSDGEAPTASSKLIKDARQALKDYKENL